MKIPRKLKKRVIKVFSRNTYYGIRDEHLKLRKINKSGGVITHFTKTRNHNYYPGEHNPRLLFPNIN